MYATFTPYSEAQAHIQAAPIAKPDAEETWITVPAGADDVPNRIVGWAEL